MHTSIQEKIIKKKTELKLLKSILKKVREIKEYKCYEKEKLELKYLDDQIKAS